MHMSIHTYDCQTMVEETSQEIIFPILATFKTTCYITNYIFILIFCIYCNIVPNQSVAPVPTRSSSNDKVGEDNVNGKVVVTVNTSWCSYKQNNINIVSV